MSILSFEFLGFVAAVAALNYLLPVRARWVLLLAASLLFYALSGWRGLAYLACCAAIVWAGALLLGALRDREAAARAKGDGETARRMKRRRGALSAALLSALFAALSLVKYSGALLAGLGMPMLALAAPLGLSYFTFQGAGYLIDASRGKASPERNPLRILLFLSFFPQMAQGPISPHAQLAPQLSSPRRFAPEAFVAGFQLVLWGCFKKLVLADRLAPVTELIAGDAAQPGWLILLGAALYAVRLYADFSGGMDVIRGVAAMLGVEMVENFRRPFFSLSVAEYWRRWHMSLGAWFRSYLFYPLTTSPLGLALSKLGCKFLGKKAGRALPGAVATLVIFLLIGVWHVASWNAVLYGAYFGALMGGSMLLEPAFKAIKARLRIRDKGPLWRAFGMARTWALVLLAQVFALAAGPRQAFRLLADAARNWQFSGAAARLTKLLPPLEWCIAGAALLLVLAVDLQYERGVEVNDKLARGPFPIRWIVLILLIVSALVLGRYGEGYDGAAFLYTQF